MHSGDDDITAVAFDGESTDVVRVFSRIVVFIILVAGFANFGKFVFLPGQCHHGGLVAQIACVCWVAVGEEGAIGRHEPPPLAELVVFVLSQQLGEASDVEHDGRRVEVGGRREMAARESEVPDCERWLSSDIIHRQLIACFPRKGASEARHEARRNVPKVDAALSDVFLLGVRAAHLATRQ